MISIKGKSYFTDDEWMLLLKQNEVANTPHPQYRIFRTPLCPTDKQKLTKIMCWQPVPGTDALPFILNNYVWVCKCGYKYSDGDMTKGEFRIQNTVQYQELDITTGKTYDDVTCANILERINREGNAQAQIELAKLYRHVPKHG